MLENIEDVKLFIEWCNEHKVKSFRSKGIEFELSELSFIDSGDDLVSQLKSGENPLGDLTSMAPDSDALKKLVFISDVEAIIVNIQSDGKLGSTANAEASVAVTASDKEKKRAAQQSIREALNTLGLSLIHI